MLRPLLAFQMKNVRACAERGGIIAAGSDSGAYLVPHVQGIRDELALLKQAGIDEKMLLAGEKRIREIF